jgi:hypothetical protein
VLRGLWPDRNPLRRSTDRVQSYLLAGLFVATVAAAPFAAQTASHAAYAGALRQQQVQLATTHQVRAVLTRVALSTISESAASAASPVVPVAATWTSVTGVHRTGLVMARSGSPRGSAVTVWTDDAGDLKSPPLESSQVSGQGELAAIGAVTGLGLLCLCALIIVRHAVNRRRMAAWEAAWVVTARVWNRQRW